MKTYTVLAKQTLIETWTYTVEAESEEEAIQLVEEGEIEDNEDHYQKDLGNLTLVVIGLNSDGGTPPCVGHDTASWEEEEKLNERMDVIGQNGNEGTHYDNQN